MVTTIADWIARLEGALGDLTVHGAADLASARDDHKRDAAYVYPLADTAAESVSPTSLLQLRSTRYGVLLALTNRRDRRGESGLEEIERRRNQVESALAGWLPAGAERAVTFRRGALVGIGDGVLLWQDEYEVSWWSAPKET